MNNVVVLSPQELENMLGRAAEAAARKVLDCLQPMVDVGDVAAMYGVSERTVRRMEQRGDLPPRAGKYWNRTAIQQLAQDRWDRAGMPPTTRESTRSR